MTVVVTRNVTLRLRGFLTSCMLEVAPGVYISPQMTKGVRERMWSVCQGWFNCWEDASLVLTWQSSEEPGGQGLLVLGEAPKHVVDHEGMLLVRRPLTKKNERQFKKSSFPTSRG